MSKHTEGEVECMCCEEMVNKSDAKYSLGFKAWACNDCLNSDKEE